MTTAFPKLNGSEVLSPIDDIEMAAPAQKQKGGNQKTAGRFADLNAFVDMSMAKLTRAEIAVWMVLYRDTRDGTARTSQGDMARRAGVDDRTVRRAIEGLKKRGLVMVVCKGGLNRGPSRYRVRGALVLGPLRTQAS
jgi:hypothetical protein